MSLACGWLPRTWGKYIVTGGKKGRLRLFDRDSVFSPEKELSTAVGADRHLRDQQVPCLFIDGAPMYESLDIISWLEANPAEL